MGTPSASNALASNQSVDPDNIDVRQVRRALGLSYEEMGRLLDVSGRTIRRWENQVAVQPDSLRGRQLAQLHLIAVIGTQVFKPDGLKEFMRTQLPTFDGSTALQLLRQGDGRAVVYELTAEYEGYGF